MPPQEVRDAQGPTQARRILLDQHADARTGPGVCVLRRAARLDLPRDARDGLLHQGGRPRHRRPLRRQLAAHAARHAAVHRRDGQGRDADATAEKVKSLGGDAKPPFDIMDKGRMAVCFDPNGAEFDVWEPRAAQGTDVDTSEHGAPSWSRRLPATSPAPRRSTPLSSDGRPRPSRSRASITRSSISTASPSRA